MGFYIMLTPNSWAAFSTFHRNGRSWGRFDRLTRAMRPTALSDPADDATEIMSQRLS
jgi:hypothetical protein